MSRTCLLACLFTLTLAGCGGTARPLAVPPAAGPGAIAQATLDIPASLDAPHRAFGVTTAAAAVAAVEQVQPGRRRLLASSSQLGCCGESDGRVAPNLIGTAPSGRTLGTVASLAALAPNAYAVGSDRLEPVGNLAAGRCVGILGWRFDDWTDQLGDFRDGELKLDGLSTRSRDAARRAGSAAFEDEQGQTRFDPAKGPAWSRFGGYPQRWTVSIYSVGRSGRISDPTYAGDASGGAVPGGFLVARAAFERPFRTVVWGGLVTEGVNAGQAAPPGRYAAILEPASPAVSPEADADSDGIPDASDDFPKDATLAFEQDYPIGSEAWYAFEDLYPNRGDADYNDFVVAYQAQQRFDARKRLVSVSIDIRAEARGAGYDHALLMDLRDTFKGGGKATVEELSATGTVVRSAAYGLADGPITVFASSRAALQPPSGQWATNAIPSTAFVPGRTARVTLTLVDPGANMMGAVAAPPYDLYCHVANTNQDVHLPRIDTNGDGVMDAANVAGVVRPMIDPSGYPWALEVPVRWRWPLEGVRLETAYPDMKTWVASGRGDALDWYLHPAPPRAAGTQPSSPWGDVDRDGWLDFIFNRTLFL